jgi:hypothetical protein
MKATPWVVGALLALTPTGSAGQAVDVGADVSAETRFFPSAPRFPAQEGARVSPSVVFEPEIEVESGDRRWRVVGQGFLRLDAHDGNRSHADVRELGLSYFGDRVTAFVGAGQVFWGVTEVRHLVDIVNQLDAVEDLDGEDKLGQPMVALTLESPWGVLDAYLLPYFRERTFPGDDARLRGPVPFTDDAGFTAGQGHWSPDFAVRGFRTVGALDLGVSFFRGTSREPRFEAAPSPEGGAQLVPLYDRIDQVGLDAQWTGARTLLKLEAITRGGHAERIYALTGGVEHTLYQIFGTAGDLGIVAEGMFDSRGGGAPPTLFEHDAFVGGRWAWNDVADTSVLVGPLVDLSNGETLLLLEMERRIGSDWSFGTDARLFLHTDAGSLLDGVRRDGFVSIALTRFF